MTIYTRRGDHGETSLVDGTRVPKDSTRVEAYGTVDELNSAIGFARSAIDDALLDDVLHFMQQRLFNCSSSLATPAESRTDRTPIVEPEDVTLLERAIDRFEATTGPLEHFVIEAGSEAASRLQLARAIARRAERRVVALASEASIDAQVMAFVNRSSDALFAAARYANALDARADELWDPKALRPDIQPGS